MGPSGRHNAVCPTCNLLYGDCIGALWTLPVYCIIHVTKMAMRMAAVLRAPGKLCSFSYVLFFVFFVLRVRCC